MPCANTTSIRLRFTFSGSWCWADDKFREKVPADTANPLLTIFGKKYNEKLCDSEQMSKFSPPINKVDKLLRPSLIPIIGQTKSLDFLDIMNTK